MQSDLAKNSALIFIALIIASALNYGFYLVIGRVLSVVEYGTVVSLIAVVSLVTAPAALGQVVIAKLVAQRAPQGGAIPCDVLKATILCSAGFGLLIVACGFVGRNALASFLHLEHSGDIAITALATALGVALFLNRGLLQGAQLFRAFALVNVIDGAARLLIVLFTARQFGVTGALTTTAIAIFAALVYGGVIAYRRRYVLIAQPPSIGQLESGIAATAAISFVLIALGLYDPILAKHYLSAADAGAYGVMALAGRTVGIILSFIPVMMLPNVINRTARNVSARRVLAAGVLCAIVLSITAVVACSFASPFIVTILAGRAFLRAAPFLTLYVAAASLLAVAAVLGSYLIAKHDFRAIPSLTFAAFLEVLAVVLRHASLDDIVQDVFAGHLAVAIVTTAALARRGQSGRLVNREAQIAEQV